MLARDALGWVERWGNRLPEPATLFVLGAVLVLVLSEVGARAGWAAQVSGSGERVEVTSLLSQDGLQWVWLSLVESFTGFAPLGVVLVVMLGIGVAERSGLIEAAIRWLLGVLSPRLVTPGVVFTGVMSSLAADAGFVVLPPLAASLFERLGRAPLAGLAAAFAGVAGGFSANLFVTALDPMLASATEQAARLVAPETVVPATANYGFMVASTLIVTLAGWAVTARVIEPRLSRAAGSDPSTLGDLESRSSAERLAPKPPPASRGRDPSPSELGEGEQADRAALLGAGAAAVVVGGALLFMVLDEHGPLHGHTTTRQGVEVAVWPSALVPMLFVLSLVPGIVFGVVRGTIRSDRDVTRMMTESMASMSEYIVLAFFCGQFVAWFAKSGLGTLLALYGIEVLTGAGLPRALLVGGVVLFSAGLNLFIGSASAKWFLLAPVFVPLLLGLGISPELTQAAYRVGDSATNVIAPLNPYMPLVLAFTRRYVPSAGLGTLLAVMLPHALALLGIWTAVLFLWMAADIPLGPGSGPLFVEPMLRGLEAIP